MKLTQRDHQILCFLSDQGVATLSQLTQEFFLTEKACRSRLHILLTAKLIESVSVQELRKLSLTAFQKMSDILRVSTAELWKYRLYRLTSALRGKRAGTESLSQLKMWRHQIQLNGVRRFFKESFPNALLLTEFDVQTEWSRYLADCS